MTTGRGGFSLIETLVALVILALGLFAMAATSAAVTTTLTGSRFATIATQLASQRAEVLRATARSTVPPCTAGGFTSSASAITTQGVTMSWTVAASGSTRAVNVITTYPVGRGRTRTDTLRTLIPCTG